MVHIWVNLLIHSFNLSKSFTLNNTLSLSTCLCNWIADIYFYYVVNLTGCINSNFDNKKI